MRSRGEGEIGERSGAAIRPQRNPRAEGRAGRRRAARKGVMLGKGGAAPGPPPIPPLLPPQCHVGAWLGPAAPGAGGGEAVHTSTRAQYWDPHTRHWAPTPGTGTPHLTLGPPHPVLTRYGGWGAMRTLRMAPTLCV